VSYQTESDILWGVKAIARALGRTERATFHLCEKGHLPVAKIGGRWCISWAKLRAFIDGEVVAS